METEGCLRHMVVAIQPIFSCQEYSAKKYVKYNVKC